MDLVRRRWKPCPSCSIQGTAKCAEQLSGTLPAASRVEQEQWGQEGRVGAIGMWGEREKLDVVVLLIEMLFIWLTCAERG